MTKIIKDFFELIEETYKDNKERYPRIKTVIDNYDDEYRKQIVYIAKEATEKELVEAYNNAYEDGSLLTNGLIAFALASNKNLPKSIVNELCFIGVPDSDFHMPLLKNHVDALSKPSFAEIYDNNKYTVRSGMVSSHYNREPTKEDILYPERIMNFIALKEFDNFSEKLRDDCPIFRYLTDMEFVDKLLDKVRNSSENKEFVINEILNNTFISEEQRNKIFDEFGCDFRKVLIPTPYMVDTMYRITVETVFKSDMDRYSSKTEEERIAYRESIFVLEKLAGKGLLTSGMEYDLMKMIVDRKDRSSEMLTSEIVRTTKDPRVLHIALQLKSTNDKDRAIANKHLSAEDIVAVSKVSQKNIERDLKKGYYASPKHRDRLADLADRATLPDDVYETIFKINDTSVEEAVARSIYTPYSVLEKELDLILSKTRGYRYSSEFDTRCMMFAIKNTLPRDKARNLMEAVSYLSMGKIQGYMEQQKNTAIKNFLSDNPNINSFKKFLKEMSTVLSNEQYQKASLKAIECIENPPDFTKFYSSSKVPLSEYTNQQINSEMSRLAYLSEGYSTSTKMRFYLEIEKDAQKYIELYQEKEKREKEALKEMPSSTQER